MSMYGGSGGGRTRMGTKVYLNIYDLSPANDCLYPVGFGLHHSGVEIMGSEYSYASGGGIFEGTPREAPGARFREQIELGTFEGGSSELRVKLDDLRSSFGPSDYNLIQKNCNHFANALVWALMRRPIPPHVNRLADVANCFSCLIPRSILDESPVGPNAGRSSSGGDNSSAGFQVFKADSRSANDGGGPTAPTAAFIGRGSRLGGGSTDTTSTTSTANGSTASSSGGGIFGFGGGTAGSRGSKATKEDDLTDRREKARQAALARLERNAN
mmetsp:Transcript_35490/g.77734  ORF Transcript_35490/g.77734 Transcript_35490/m.77734 type:complete len:271 (-) Transcript_35490:101-913(-)